MSKSICLYLSSDNESKFFASVLLLPSPPLHVYSVYVTCYTCMSILPEQITLARELYIQDLASAHSAYDAQTFCYRLPDELVQFSHSELLRRETDSTSIRTQKIVLGVGSKHFSNTKVEQLQIRRLRDLRLPGINTGI